MLIGLHRMDVVANNLANASTAGFRSADTLQRAFPTLLIERVEKIGQSTGQVAAHRATLGELGIGATIDGTYTNFAAGALRHTENPLDVALLEPDVFFTIAVAGGQRYTRNGTFQLNTNGELTNASGHQVLGSRGPIRMDGTKVIIDQDGFVYVDDVLVDRLLITTFAAPELLTREAGQYFAALPEAGAYTPDEFTVLQGQLEQSNVNVVQELVKMINVQRAYEASQKAVRAADDTLAKLVNELNV
jgi:flagellar basal-body rod protein FlgF